ncbi:LacI family DNA-binding transcriptional regulator [Novosphingobium sp. 9]|uniref:LacI family DNA-binding transcriptional regulator n=1 Tax=Novosphingobium sp. 9 TaxID=2025349 RepID=UPI0021B5D270|nr:LacI family DNA-binding transcriptional regulator [Novosphingobium sp. 9]
MARPITASGPTIEHVASEAGVSIRTVSRVLNKSPKVNAATRERIEAAIARLDFRPSPRGRALAMGRSFLIGLVHNDRNALVLDAVQRGIVNHASARGYELVVHPCPLDPQDAAVDVLSFLQRSRVDGLIVMPPVSGLEPLAQVLARNGLPAIAVSSVPLPHYGEVILSDEREAAAMVARHLIALGHRHLGLINGPVETASAMQRRQGFLSGAQGAGITVTQSPGDYGFASGIVGAEILLSSDEPPSAIFAANDVMAAGVLKYAAQHGIAVPRDLSVAGFDGSLLASMVSPALATVIRPFDRIASEAARRLLDRIDGIDSEPAIIPALTLDPGESCARWTG